jgi:hypothetical protein
MSMPLIPRMSNPVVILVSSRIGCNVERAFSGVQCGPTG